MKNIAHSILNLVPPYVLFLLGFGSMVAFGFVKLYAALEAVGLNQ